ncbi:hypothetical protein ACQ4PT_007473 [Festuca glaucescens]
MMEVVAERAWDQFKEEVEIMGEEGGRDAAAGELLTREIKKRLLDQAAHENGNGNGHVNGGEAEEEEAAEEEEQHKTISDPAKGLWKCRHYDWMYHLASPCQNGILNHQGYRHQIERKSLVQKEPFYGWLNRVPHIITEVSARYLVTEAALSGPEEEETNATPSPKGKEIEAHENGSAQDANGSHTNGSHQVSNVAEPEIAYMLRIDKTEIFPDEVEKEEHVTEAQPEEKGSQSNGSHLLSSGANPEIPYMFRIDKTEIFLDEVDKDEHVTETQPEENGSHSNSSHQVPNGTEPEITYMFQIDKTEIFPAEVAKDEHVTEAQADIEEYDLEKILDQQETHDLYCPNCKSCITRRVILRKRKRTARPTTPSEPPKRPHTEEAPLAPAPGSDGQEPPDVFRCLSCFSFFIPTGCSFNIFRIFGRRDQQVDVLPPPASEDMPPSANCTSWLLSCFQPGDSPNQAAAHSLQTPLLHDAATSSDTATTTTATSASYVHTDDTVVKPEQSTDESSSSTHQTTTTTITTTTTSATATTSSTTTSAAASTSSHTSSAIGIIPRGDIPTSPNSQAADPHHVAVSVSEDVNPAAPRPQQRDDWDILKAIVYGGLVESITSLSVVSAAASSGAKTLDIFILGIANLIGGLPLIFHNIADLRDIQDVDGNDERVGHYWLNLGRRSKAQLHMVMALLSYIVFGLLPPVLYGLSFRKSNDRENKMMAVAAASLACIALLALGKAHVKSRPRTYFKTLMYYLTIAVSCSGLSYFAGVLITRILVSYGVIDEGASGAPAPPGLSLFPHAVGAETSAWASF